MVNNGFVTGKRMELWSKHHTLCVQVPLFHIFGSVSGIIASLTYGSTMVLPTDGYQPDKTLDALKNEKYITMVHTVLF